MRRLIFAMLCLMLGATVMPSGAKAQGDDHQTGETDHQAGAVFLMTNDATANQIISFTRANDGSLVETGKTATGGRGSGGAVDPLQSQGSLTLSADHKLLFAVNAGSGEITVFRVHGSRLERIQVVSSGGSAPVALAQRADLLYVYNAGPAADIVAFRLDANQALHEISGSGKSLSNGNPGGSGLTISPNGRFLAVTERLNNLIDIFPINSDGTLGPIVSTPSSGAGPFSIEFSPNGALLATEAPAAAISSYQVVGAGALTVVSGSLSTLGQAACWHVITPDGRFVYTSNAGSSSISGFAIGPNGALTPVGSTVLAVQPAGSTNLDLAVTQNGKLLYSLNTGTGTVGIFAIQPDGTLLSLGTANGFAAASGANGIAAF